MALPVAALLIRAAIEYNLSAVAGTYGLAIAPVFHMAKKVGYRFKNSSAKTQPKKEKTKNLSTS
jgi:fructose-1,6-bisphosphatase